MRAEWGVFTGGLRVGGDGSSDVDPTELLLQRVW